MQQEKILPILKGIISTMIPLRKFKTLPPTGGSINSRYYYSVWLRHLVTASNNGLITTIPGTVAELGPGDSIGLGLAALLSGSKKYHALDIYKYWNAKTNLQVFDELLQLFRNKTPIPGVDEFPHINPLLDDHRFPAHLLTDELLHQTLAVVRIKKLRCEIEHPEEISEQNFISYCAPWWGKEVIKPGSADMIISQSVLEYVDDLETAYKIMSEWLKPGGAMSHSIDLSSLGLTKEWNGHWTYSDLQWRLYKGKRIMYINRAPQSLHLSLMSKTGLEIIHKSSYKKENKIKTADLAKAYRNLSEEDLETIGLFIQCRKQVDGFMVKKN